jgi:stalled ribosome rescue protein Dom34
MSATNTNSTPAKYNCECGKTYKLHTAFLKHKHKCSTHKPHDMDFIMRHQKKMADLITENQNAKPYETDILTLQKDIIDMLILQNKEMVLQNKEQAVIIKEQNEERKRYNKEKSDTIRALITKIGSNNNVITTTTNNDFDFQSFLKRGLNIADFTK